MTPEQILELAARAGADTQDGGKHWEFDDFSPEKFAKLIEAATREECAEKVEQDLWPVVTTEYQVQYNAGIRRLADKIRSGT